MSIRIKLILAFLGVSLAPLLLTAWYPFVVANRALARHADERVNLTADMERLRVQAQLRRFEDAVHAATRDVAFTEARVNFTMPGDDSKNLQAVLARHAQAVAGDAEFTFTAHAADRGIRATSGSTPNSESTSRTKTPAAEDHAAQNQTFPARQNNRPRPELYIHSSGDAWINMRAPVEREGRHIGDLQARAPLSAVIATVASSRRLGSTGELLVVSRGRNDQVVTVDITRAEPRILKLWNEPDAATFASRNDRQAVTRRLSSVDWILMASQDPTESATPRRDLLHSLLMIGAVEVLLVTLMAMFIGRRLTHPIECLADVAESVRKGEPHDPIRIDSRDEIGRLAEAFTQMTDDLIDATSNLEDRVTQRTKQLRTINDSLRDEIQYRQGVENALRQSQSAASESAAKALQQGHFLETLLDHLPLGVFVKDGRSQHFGKFIFWNRQCESLFGISADDAIGHDAHDFFSREDAEFFRSLDHKAFARGLVEDIATVGADAQGKPRLLHTVKAPILDAHGQPLYLLCIAEDITEQRSNERALIAAQRELRLAREIQFALLPMEAPDTPGYDIAGMCFPAADVGGDYFDYLDLPDGNLAIAVGDASGHGVGPALLAAETRACIRTLAPMHHCPGRILTEANRIICHGIPDNRFITQVIVCLDTKTHTFSFANAGHPSAMVIDSAGRLIYELASTGLPLGLDEDETFTRIDGPTLNPGDTLLMVTDGVHDALGVGQGSGGRTRLLEQLAGRICGSTANMVDDLYEQLADGVHPESALDDITLVVIRRT